MNDQIKELINSNIPLLQTQVKEFGKYEVLPVDLNRIIYFLSQFKSSEEVDFVIRLLKRIEFLDSDRITYLLTLAYQKIDPALVKKPLISALGTIQDSSAIICYRLLKDLFGDEEGGLRQISDITSVGRETSENPPSSIIFFDDNITSGTQLLQFFTEWFEGTDKPELVKTPLTEAEKLEVKKIPIVICYAIQLSEKSNPIIEQIRKQFEIDLSVYWGKVDYSNHLDYQSQVVKSRQESEFAKEFIMDISRPLYEDKDWDDSKLYYRLLGYGNLGKLTTFYYNVPKSLIPIFWKYGRINGKPWIPLFPEIQEKKKMQKDGAEINLQVIGEVLTFGASKESKRNPEVHFGFGTNKGNVEVLETKKRNEIIIKVPSQIVLEQEIFSAYPIEYLPTEPNPDNSIDTGMDFLYGKIKNPNSVSNDEYFAYTSAVDSFNEELDAFYKDVCKFLTRISTLTELRLLLANQGNLRSTHTTVKVSYNTKYVTFNKASELGVPEFKTVPPKLQRYNSSNPMIEVVNNPLTAESLSDSIIYKKETIKENEDWVIRPFDNVNVGKNDYVLENIDLIRMDVEKSEFELDYDLDYEENPETVNGVLKIRFEEVDLIEPVIAENLKNRLKVFAKKWQNF